MKETENKKSVVFVTDGNSNETSDVVLESKLNQVEKIKKSLIYALMGVAFLGCMYLIFKPSEDTKKMENIGLNDAVPQATDAGLEADKQKAYEQEMLEQKYQEKQNALTSLSDYWNEGNPKGTIGADSEITDEDARKPVKNTNPALNSYRNAQSTVGSFYQNDPSETQQLRKQLDELKKELDHKDSEPINPVETQLELMEKSYQMAAKYLPMNASSAEQSLPQSVSSSSSPKEKFVALAPSQKNAVSSLCRAPTDSAFLVNWSKNRPPDFYTTGQTKQEVQTRNSVRAIIQETQVITAESSVRLRLLEPAKTANLLIPQGTLLTANAKFQEGRLQLKISSLAINGTILPVDITVFGLDGQQGLVVPYSPERSALTEMAANMGQASGSSIMMTNSAGQQMAGDLSRGVVQGVSGYFSKKIKTPKITLKAGYQMFLVSKN